MRNILFSAALLVLFVSCRDKKSTDEKILLDSSGSINNVSVVIDNELWNGSVGEAIRNVLTAPIYGLPQDEPTFTISQIPPSVFSGFVTKNRTVLKIEVSKEAGMEIKSDVYAQPQKVIIISGSSKEQITSAINDNASKIVKTFKNEEIAECYDENEPSNEHNNRTAPRQNLIQLNEQRSFDAKVSNDLEFDLDLIPHKVEKSKTFTADQGYISPISKI